MIYKNLSDANLHEAMGKNFRREDEATYEVLCALREVALRGLFFQYDCTSLYDYCVKVHKRSGGSAQRRIDAMRLMRDDPIIEEKIETGELSFSNAAMIASMAKKANATPEERRELVLESLHKSQKECEQLVKSAYPETFIETVELKLSLPRELFEKFTELKDYLAHENPDHSALGLFKLLVEKEVERQKRKRGEVETLRETKLREKRESTSAAEVKENENLSPDPVPFNAAVSKDSRAFSKLPTTRKLVFRRAGHACQYPNCKSRYGLEIDHVHPLARGGSDTLENLQVLCKPHHRKVSEEYGFSPRKVESQSFRGRSKIEK